MPRNPRVALQQLRAKFVDVYGKASTRLTKELSPVKEVLEKYNMVITVTASLASAGAAWAGYTARQWHQRQIEDRLDSMEHAMATVHVMDDGTSVRIITHNTGITPTTCAAAAGTSLLVGIALGWRGAHSLKLRHLHQHMKEIKLFIPGPRSSPHDPPKRMPK